MHVRKQSILSGWGLTGVISAALVATAAAALVLTPDSVEGARLVIRLTARISLALFLLAFTASALLRLVSSPVTRWLRENRRYLGVSFAASHFVHLAAIVMLARLDPALFLRLTNIVTYVGGGLGYLFIILMTATSFDRTAAQVGSRAWAWLHATGMWYLWLSFALNFGKRAPISPLYLIPVGFIGLAGIIRLVASRRGRVEAAHAG